jgi:ubiquinone biosynthesis protein UbiJ
VGDRVEQVSDSVVRADCTISVSLSRILTLCSSGLYSAHVDTNALVEPAELARRFRMIMGDLRWSRKRLSEVTGISRPSLSNKLNGDVEFTYAELVAVIDALGVAWEELLANPFHGRPASFTSPPRLKDLRSRRDRRL